MVDLPSFEDVDDVGDAVQQRGRTLIPWLPDPQNCPECGSLMYAGETFDPRMVETVACWTCRECGTETYRDDPVDYEPTGPTAGASKLREALEK